jgi:hypothetical protein
MYKENGVSKVRHALFTIEELKIESISLTLSLTHRHTHTLSSDCHACGYIKVSSIFLSETTEKCTTCRSSVRLEYRLAKRSNLIMKIDLKFLFESFLISLTNKVFLCTKLSLNCCTFCL